MHERNNNDLKGRSIKMAFAYKLKNNGKTMEVQDPIYGKIEIQSPFTEIILTKEMQRLNDIQV